MSPRIEPTPSAFAVASAVLFDYNGTLSDDEPVIADLVIAIAREHLRVAVTSEMYFAQLAGLTEREMFHRLIRGSGHTPDAPAALADELVDVFTHAYAERTGGGSHIADHTRDLVHHLHAEGVVLGVVTSASRAMVEAPLRSAGLWRAFATVRTLDDVASPKPDPAGYQLAIADLPPHARHRAVAVEDSRAGIAAARAAGLPVIGVIGTTPEAELRRISDWVVDRLSPDRSLSAEHSR